MALTLALCREAISGGSLLWGWLSVGHLDPPRKLPAGLCPVEEKGIHQATPLASFGIGGEENTEI